ncbi:MAG: cupin domain-containing protein [Alphaproteobacteria bacterium]|nr:cupin domain-containing protein [Alphaproteobacteria bacterium]
MSAYKVLTGHGAPAPTIPKPKVAPRPSIVTVQDGLPVIYGAETVPACGVRVVHPTNPRARSKNHTIAMLYIPPHAVMELHSHETEETYCVLVGTGKLLTEDGERDVGPGTFIYLPSWCMHGIRNTGLTTMEVLLATSPPNP